MHLKKLFAVALTLFATIALMAGTAQAQVSQARVVQTIPGPVADHVTSDILIDFAGQYTGSQMIVELTEGTIYQNALGGPTAPNPAFFALDAALEFDTFLANGGPTTLTTVGNFGLGGAAINVAQNHKGQGTTRSPVFADADIDQSWNPAGGNVIEDQDGFMIARLTLSNNANGMFRFVSSAGGVISVPEIVSASGAVFAGGETGVTVPIVNGVIGEGVIIPEPSTVILLGIGLVGLVALKRRNG